MLQVNNLRWAEQQRLSQNASAAEFYAASIGFLRRQFLAIVLTLLLSLVVGAVYILTCPRYYTGHAILIVDAPKTQTFQSQSSPREGPIDSATVDTQIQILTSDDIALSAIKELHLDEDREFILSSSGVFSAVTSFISNTISGIIKAVLPADLQTSGEQSNESRALQTFHKHLKVRRVAITYAIEIEFESRNPYRAAQIANAIADAYELAAFEAKYQIKGRAAEWLQGRLRELRDQTSDSEHAVVDYKAEHNIVDTGGRLMNEQQLAELNSELIQARASTAAAKARLDRVQQIVASGDVDPEATATATVADTLQNGVINKLRGQYLDNERRAADWAAKYGAGHLAVVGLRNQMAELRHNIFEELKRAAESYKNDYAIAKARGESIQDSLDHIITNSHKTDAARIALRNLESSAQTYRDVYDSFLQRYTESVQQQSSPVSESRLITHARPPLTKSWPKSSLVMAIAALGGLVFGAAIGMLRDVSDRVFRTTMQVGEHLQADCLAVIPLVSEVAEPASFQKAKAAGPTVPAGSPPARSWSGLINFLLSLFTKMRQRIVSIPRNLSDRVFRIVAFGEQRFLDLEHHPRRRRRRRRTLRRDQSVSWTVTNSPFSRFSESIRAVKVAADTNVAKVSKTIGVTSALPNEGKSTVALSLATLITQGGGRAVLVDCDLRNPALSRMLTPDAEAGLLEIISGKTAIEDVLWREPATGLAFLPVMLKARVAHSSDILASKETRELFERLRDSYDYVIIDLSPLAPVVDVRVVTHLVDSFLFVIEWGRTKIDVAQLALSSARGVSDNLLGIVLNKADMKAFGRYANYHGNYYNNSYYGRYGYTD
jgi:succinoglycan biosynthesis transport protein ExoP